MTINEIETITGLDRGTVRYYEAEGLIKPARRVNGYRDYSREDLEKLRKVKLLRAPNFSIDDIRSMDSGGADFPDRLCARVRSLEARAEDIEDAKRVIQNMLTDGAEYKSLQSGIYLTSLSPELRPSPRPFRRKLIPGMSPRRTSTTPAPGTGILPE